MSGGMRRGYIAMPRSIFEDEAFRPEPFSQREAYLYLVAAASWRPRKERIGRAVVDLERGQLAASMRFLAAKWGWSEAKVRRFLARLSERRSRDAPNDPHPDAPSDALIDAVSTRDVTVITIRNYDNFNKPAAETPDASDAPSAAADEPVVGAHGVSKSTQRGKENQVVDNYIPFAEANGDGREPRKTNIVAITRPIASPKTSSMPAVVDAQITPAAVLFGECRKYLERSGLTADRARRIVGGWRKNFTDAEIIDAISRAQREEAQEPIAFINGYLKRRQGGGDASVGAMSAISALERYR
jgi:hypothetical protein